jgi:hypothetical protein
MQQLFQQYQAAFNAYLRNPGQQAKPRGVNANRISIYREIVFNNFLASVSACFPVLLSILGKRRFRQLTRHCFTSHYFGSPLFADIPKAFVDFLQTLDLAKYDLPPFTAQLAHYEWVELHVAKLPDKTQSTSPVVRIDQASDLAGIILQLPAAHMLVSYDYPVHQLSKKHRGLAASPTYVLAFRKADFTIAFIQLNAVTYSLLQRIQSEQVTVSSHFMQLAQTLLPHLPLQIISEFGLQTLYTLHLQQAVIPA